jgi:ABC-2 type transport system permease protein
VLGGLRLGPALLVFALANLTFSLADVVTGHLDELPRFIRTGTLDAMLVRPLPLLAQLVTSDISLRRLGRAGLALVVLLVALPLAVPHWTPSSVGMLLLAPVTGTAIFAALFTAAAGAQFWLVEGAELTNGFTYGSSYVASYPASVLAPPVRVFFTFVLPATFTAYLPALVVCDLPGPTWLPGGLGWWSPLAAVGAWLGAAALWRSGVRHYTGAGG